MNISGGESDFLLISFMCPWFQDVAWGQDFFIAQNLLF